MQKEVFIRFGADQETMVPLSASEGMSNEQARRWLDEQFVANDCEPLRPSGKVLTADKVMALATTVGPAKFADPAWANAFAKATVAALGRPTVRLDVFDGSISY